ncbi:MAG: phage tail assembly chaperone [Robiginitomaculum sp.]|nr:phage tail assembly chaperone [Robiginitomaculum sp.]
MDKWPFDLWLNFAIRRLNLTPSEFWSLSICDWMVLSAPIKSKAINQEDLQKLMQKFPDRKQDE